ncbi:MAG: sulfotransferase [Pseudomonadota bacterium]
MNANTLLALAPAMVLSCVVVVELFVRLPFMAQVEAVTGGALKAVGLVRSPRISDHWKERVLPVYAGRILKASLSLAGLLLLCAMAFVIVWVLAAWWPAGGGSAALASLSSLTVQLWLLGIGIGWALLRARFGKKEQAASDYSPSSQMLHRLALANTGMRTLCDDIDRRLAGQRAANTPVERPVYVTALARAGTTVLLEVLHGSGRFASLTYRSMPFVMAPWTWGAVSKPRPVDPSALKERAHGDRLKVGVDSPEAFEEVFWNSYAERATRAPDGLQPAGKPDEAVLERYRNFVQRILARDGKTNGARRYLSKNNNNLLRLPWLRTAFPDAVIVTPFRNPVDHVQSLMRQHERFLERHAEDPFSLEYMDWLGHHEFGAHFLPFKFGPDVVPRSADALLEPAYWFDYWAAVYRYLLAHHAGEVIWFDYDAFCDRPGDLLTRLEGELDLEAGALSQQAGRISRSERPADLKIVAALTDDCREVHAQLRQHAFGAG